MTTHTEKIKQLQDKKERLWEQMLASERHARWHSDQAGKRLREWMSANNVQWPLIRQELEAKEQANDA
tara:strand:+ start:44 stop:247 length:204 start_codon:yes stop_codon:yes gene_type:complete